MFHVKHYFWRILRIEEKMTETFLKDIKFNSEKIGIKLSDKQIQQLYRFYELLVEKNKVMNLTAITEEHDVVVKHFIDSMSIYNKVIDGKTVNEEYFNDKMLIDVGTGAGFPGLVLKIIFPELNIVLSDSLNKRLNFLREVIDDLQLKKIKLIHGRAEDLARDKEYRDKFDFATSRAVANLSTLTEYDLPFVKCGGYFIAYKSGKIEEELNLAKNAINKLGGIVVDQIDFMLPDEINERSFVIVKKSKKTPAQYPRKAGTPSKSPL